MDISVFTDKNKTPGDEDVKAALGKTWPLWQNIREYVHAQYPKATEEWKYPGDKYGWSFRLNDKKRVIVYLLPRDKYFKVALVFGEKASEAVMASHISEEIKNELMVAKPYAEGRGIRIDVKSEAILKDIKTLVDIKIHN